MESETGCRRRAGGASHGVKRERGYVAEIFASVQGEGIYVGERHVFVRMSGCSATCSWCDTIDAKDKRVRCVVYGPQERLLLNPLSVEDAASEVLALIRQSGPIRTVSFTGGEPLEQAGFVGELAGTLRGEGYRIYLDTNGLETDGVARIMDCVDVIALDIKLPSALGKPHWEAHRAFLRATEGVERFVKVVVDGSTTMGELKDAVEVVAEHDPRIPLVLQPESTALLDSARTDAGRRVISLLEDAQRHALGRLHDVRVIPQCHKLLKVR
jgi:7-carboxy-7-deazaguanine synthase